MPRNTLKFFSIHGAFALFKADDKTIAKATETNIPSDEVVPIWYAIIPGLKKFNIFDLYIRLMIVKPKIK